MKVHKFTFNPFQENTYILSIDNGDCIIIDPGCYEPHEQERLKSYINDNGLNPVKLLNTHCHIDHILGNYFVATTYDLELGIHEKDLPTLNSVASYAHVYGFEKYQLSPEPSYFLNEGDEIILGDEKLTVIFGPGHAPGHVAFYNAKDSFVINGDILFQGSFGRVDLPGGNFTTLKETILKKMFALPEGTLVYTGHGGETTIGREKESNPINFVQL